MNVPCVRTIPMGYRVSTKIGWKSILLRNINRINRLRMKRLNPIDHDLRLSSSTFLYYINFLAASANPRHVRYPSHIPDSYLTAKYSLDDTSANGRPEHAILNNKQGSWCSFYHRQGEWLELDLGSDHTMYGVAVQGAHNSDSKVTNYTIGLRVDGASADTWLLEMVCVL